MIKLSSPGHGKFGHSLFMLSSLQWSNMPYRLSLVPVINVLKITVVCYLSLKQKVCVCRQVLKRQQGVNLTSQVNVHCWNDNHSSILCKVKPNTL